jgi:hypothetical protein
VSRWQEGLTYDYYGVPLTCVRRYFDGPLEMVELRPPTQTPGDVLACASEPIVRTARTLAPCVKPRVTETLGGVTNRDYCDHRGFGRVVADAGPNAGKECCDGCGCAL